MTLFLGDLFQEVIITLDIINNTKRISEDKFKPSPPYPFVFQNQGVAFMPPRELRKERRGGEDNPDDIIQFLPRL
ncbi:hypothetical protein TNCV_2327911 [Trichonephila clavipes]|nr:hypothetical protein TNCV_2327911 [Trichonephila clavipes]